MDNLSRCAREAQKKGMSYGQYMAWKDREKLDAKVSEWRAAVTEQNLIEAFERKERRELEMNQILHAVDLKKQMTEAYDNILEEFWRIYNENFPKHLLTYPVQRIEQDLQNAREAAESNNDIHGYQFLREVKDIMKRAKESGRWEQPKRKTCLRCHCEYVFNPHASHGMPKTTNKVFCSFACRDAYYKELK